MDDLEIDTPTIADISIGKMILKELLVSSAVTAISMATLLGIGYAWSRYSDSQHRRKPVKIRIA